MGGSGSGNHYHWRRHGKKTTVEECLTIDANRWMRDGVLRAGVHLAGSYQWTYRSGRTCSINYEVRTLGAEAPSVRLSYSWSRPDAEKREVLDYRVALATTRPRFGGLRWWFICPLIVHDAPCNRRVGKLHLPPRARYFGCRQCYRLTYTSCQESHKYDSVYRMMAEGTGYDLATVRRAMNRVGKEK